MLSNIQQTAIRECLRTAFAGRVFNISGVDKACAVLGRPIYVDNPCWHTMRALHCAEFANLTEQDKLELLELVAEAMGVDLPVVGTTYLRITEG